MSFCVLDYCFVDVRLFCIIFLVMGLELPFLFVVLLVVGEDIGGFMVIAKTMLCLRLKFIDHCRWLGWFYQRMIEKRNSEIQKDW